MDVFIKLGECIALQLCTILVFIFLASLTSLKFGLIFKFLKPIMGFLLGACLGAYLFNFISFEAARIGAMIFGIGGIFVASMISNSLQRI